MHARTATEHIFDSKEAMIEFLRAQARTDMAQIPEEIREPMIEELIKEALNYGIAREVDEEEALAMLAEAEVVKD